MRACAVLGMSNQDMLSKDLESDPFLNSALHRFTCELYYRFSSFFAPLSIGIITKRHYLSERNVEGTKNVRDNRDLMKVDLDKELSTTWNTSPSKYTGIGAAIATKLMIGFWFGIGVILAVGVVDSLNYCVEVLTSSGSSK